jgi:hypothetical protein
MRRFYQTSGLSGRQEFVESSPAKALFDRECVSFLSIWWFALILPVLTPLYARFPKLPQYSCLFSFDLLAASSLSLLMVACTIPSPFLLSLSLRPHPPIYHVASATMHEPGNDQGVYS